jgi:hypothetical protein
MTFIPAPFTVAVDMHLLMDGQQTMNRFHFKHAGSDPTIDDMEELASFLVTWWGANLQHYVSPYTSLTGLKLTCLTTPYSPVVELVLPQPLVGDHTGDVLPNNVCICVSWKTDGRGKSRRGRTYHGGLTSDMTTANIITPGYQAVITSAYDTLIKLLSPDWFMVVVSYQENKLQRPNALCTEITSVGIENTLDSQRRRLPGRGR